MKSLTFFKAEDSSIREASNRLQQGSSSDGCSHGIAELVQRNQAAGRLVASSHSAKK